VTRGVYASPDYLKRKGVPRSIEDFRRFDCIVTELQRQESVWSLRNQSRARVIEVAGKVTVNSVGIARELMIGGVGLGILPNMLCRNDVKAKRLMRVMTSWESPPLYAYALIQNREHIPNKTRAFLDFIAASLAAEERAARN
jgi:DNA-binding transcriptional LysR family regulator